MKLTTTKDVRDLITAYLPGAALSVALELGLFWQLAEQPQNAADVAKALGLPGNRCRYWLDFLCDVGLLDRVSEGYAPSAAACSAILEANDREAWALRAQEAREWLPAIQDLAYHIREPGSVWAAQGLTAPDYVVRMVESPERSRRFSRLLYEVHQPLAGELVSFLDMTGVRRMMDLGGGSGVVSMALLHRYPHLSAVVVDHANVCVAGREIAREFARSLPAENGIEGRLAFHAADFMREELPSGFELILECDVGVYSEALFRKLWAALNPGGRFVIVDNMIQTESLAPPSLVRRGFLESLEDPDFSFPCAGEIRATMVQAGFQSLSEQWVSNGFVVIEARK